MTFQRWESAKNRGGARHVINEMGTCCVCGKERPCFKTGQAYCVSICGPCLTRLCAASDARARWWFGIDGGRIQEVLPQGGVER